MCSSKITSKAPKQTYLHSLHIDDNVYQKSIKSREPIGTAFAQSKSGIGQGIPNELEVPVIVDDSFVTRNILIQYKYFRAEIDSEVFTPVITFKF